LEEKYKIEFSVEANRGVANIYYYILSNFSFNDAEFFLDEFQKQIERIRLIPNSFPKSKKFRRALVNRLTSIIFEIQKDKIIISDVYDNRCSKTF